jgi:hypothetical protein
MYDTTQSIVGLLLWYVGNLYCVLRNNLEVSYFSEFCLKWVTNIEATPEALRCTHIILFIICKISQVPAEFALQYSVQHYVHKAVFLTEGFLLYSDWSFPTLLWLRFFNCTLNEVFLTLTEAFPCFFLSCKANARVKLAKTGHGPHSSKLVVICVVSLLLVLFYVMFVCECVLHFCLRVSTQFQLTNVYHIIS